MSDGKRRLFGTDGIRGVANRAPMDAATALVNRAVAQMRGGDRRHRDLTERLVVEARTVIVQRQLVHRPERHGSGGGDD